MQTIFFQLPDFNENFRKEQSKKWISIAKLANWQLEASWPPLRTRRVWQRRKRTCLNWWAPTPTPAGSGPSRSPSPKTTVQNWLRTRFFLSQLNIYLPNIPFFLVRLFNSTVRTHCIFFIILVNTVTINLERFSHLLTTKNNIKSPSGEKNLTIHFK